MPYRIYAFDGIEIPEYNPVHDMGTGRADSSFQRLPHGYYDNYGSQRAPQGIRPLRARGTAIGTTAAAMKTAVDNLRQKIGVRGKLSVLFDDNALRWQWARLTSIRTPTDIQQRLRFDFDMQFTTADQQWFGVVTTETEWTWGDLTWTFGDGTAQLGESSLTTTVTATGATGTAPPDGGTLQSVTVTHNGNVKATNVALTLVVGTDTVHAFKVMNETTGHWYYYSVDVNANERLRVNVADRSVERVVITNIRSATYKWTASGKGDSEYYCELAGGGDPSLSTPDKVLLDDIQKLEGTVGSLAPGQWDYGNNDTLGYNTVYVRLADDTDPDTKASGWVKMHEEFDAFANITFSHKHEWMELDPGANILTLTVQGNESKDGSLVIEYYDHYA